MRRMVASSRSTRALRAAGYAVQSELTAKKHSPVDPRPRGTTMEAELACDARVGTMTFLNQHWTSGGLRRPAVAHGLPREFSGDRKA
jgi:hypothetical protein